MKAKYVLAALRALHDAQRLNYSMTPQEFGKIQAHITIAEIDLRLNSGLNDVEIEVEREPIEETS